MSSIGQSVLMALTVSVNRSASCNLQAVHRSQGKGKGKESIPRTPASTCTTNVRKRGLLLSLVIATSQVPDSRTELLQKYLKKSQENKEKNDKERLESYYKRNYKDYFELMGGSLEGKKGKLSDTEKGILDWLQRNK
ncbi:hypothetical protein L6164_035793 [Bauhinia variegata]|uniref:Uncharacterized protein n=1 Tax=Bauhinia variegata TaxID=167791 RepID=A0ACB9KF24_BAUVA|nr:hypothetical protein L6164_035793 [Bauhinia variegata]